MPALNVPQAAFLELPHKFRGFVGGFGSGKTWAGCSGIMRHFLEYPRVNAGYFAPTYPQIRDIFYPTVEEVAFDWGFDAVVHEGKKEVSMFRGGKYHGTILCRSMEHPNRIVGFKIGHALVDEIDILHKKKAQDAWRKIIARLRYKRDGLPNRVDVATTPEGFNFVYEQFVKQVSKNPELKSLYGLVQASTYDNEANLPDGYIEALRLSYPPQLIEAYLEGQFVNLAHGTIYRNFNRKASACNDDIEGDETLYVGMDFNVGKMAAIVHVMRNGEPRAVDELVDKYDTPEMIKSIKDRYWEYDKKTGVYRRTRHIRIYPDSSGGSRDTANASTSDLQLLEGAGFAVRAPKANPPVKDRINAMNAMFLNAAGQRRYKVNVRKCPHYVDCLEQQPYTEQGDPDKKAGLDHPNDASGYFINYEFPVAKPKIEAINIRM